MKVAFFTICLAISKYKYLKKTMSAKCRGWARKPLENYRIPKNVYSFRENPTRF